MRFISVFLFSLFLMISCSQKYQEPSYPVVEEKFDSVPIDSFSKGAISFDVARKIKMASKTYQDSLAKAKIEAEKLKKDALEKQNQLKAEQEKKSKGKNDDKPTADEETKNDNK